ncbi:Aste57867_10907 [Aphanomyces stellatus]|uniref:Aste57867_10907 protein n=1 Tax=Aphanomyces stellatus TaxID=120398 RepID=A0A485KT85_9STRA|nr:hypothetical protein As57867_010867 [Aphanomyces stellatus]VFT87775.1 Aste57867_10907 [Aphanomyces stellatus]
MSASSSSSPKMTARCLYRNKICENVRALKKNGQLHSLCEFHRLKANSNQRKLEKKKRDLPLHHHSPRHPSAAGDTKKKPGIKELWLSPSDVDYSSEEGDEDVVFWVQPVRLAPPPMCVEHILDHYEV